MWNDRLRIAEPVEESWNSLDRAGKDAVMVALQKIDDDPIAGAPLYEPLRGFWSYRVGPFRIVYRIVAEARFIIILLIQRVGEAA